VSNVLLLLPGDGIGPEVIHEAVGVLDALRCNHGLNVESANELIGGASIDRYGIPLSVETLEKARASRAVLMGAVGGPRWRDMSFEKRPEQGLLDLRKSLGLYANLRPRQLLFGVGRCLDA